MAERPILVRLEGIAIEVGGVLNGDWSFVVKRTCTRLDVSSTSPSISISDFPSQYPQVTQTKDQGLGFRVRGKGFRRETLEQSQGFLRSGWGSLWADQSVYTQMGLGPIFQTQFPLCPIQSNALFVLLLEVLKENEK